ncbi:MAG: MFS transporter [Lentimicrobium sp.]
MLTGTIQAAQCKPFGTFLLVWAGQLVSNIGSGLTAFSLGVYAYEKTQSATVYSLIILYAFLPAFLLKPIGGTLADRLDRRLLIIVGDLGSALSVGFILFMLASGYDQLWVIYSGVALCSVFVALQNPAYKASVTDLADEKDFTRASGLMQLSESSRFLISPVIAGFLFHYLSIDQLLLIDIFTFLVAVIAVFAIKGRVFNVRHQTTGKTFLSDFSSGFSYTFKTGHWYGCCP